MNPDDEEVKRMEDLLLVAANEDKVKIAKIEIAKLQAKNDAISIIKMSVSDELRARLRSIKGAPAMWKVLTQMRNELTIDMLIEKFNSTKLEDFESTKAGVIYLQGLLHEVHVTDGGTEEMSEKSSVRQTLSKMPTSWATFKYQCLAKQGRYEVPDTFEKLLTLMQEEMNIGATAGVVVDATPRKSARRPNAYVADDETKQHDDAQYQAFQAWVRREDRECYACGLKGHISTDKQCKGPPKEAKPHENKGGRYKGRKKSIKFTNKYAHFAFSAYHGDATAQLAPILKIPRLDTGEIVPRGASRTVRWKDDVGNGCIVPMLSSSLVEIIMQYKGVYNPPTRDSQWKQSVCPH